MAADNLIKDVGELHARLLDHHPILHGEISYFLKEFEEKRGNREEYRLQKSLEYTRECAERLVPEILSGLETHFVELVKKVSTATAMCNMIAEKEENQQRYIVNTLRDRDVMSRIEKEYFNLLEETDHSLNLLEVPEVEPLQSKRAARVEEWNEFMEKQCERSTSVDREFEEELRSLKSHYRDLEEKLQMASAAEN